MAKAAAKAKPATWKEGDKVKLAGTKTTGTIASVDGEIATVDWDAKTAMNRRVDVSALAKAK